MKLQKQPTRWSCAPTAFAMAMDLDVAYLMEVVGHDGGEIIFPDLPEPMCRRGFHVSELTNAALLLGYSATPVELFPSVQSTPLPSHPSRDFTIEYMAGNWTTFQHHIRVSAGVLECRTIGAAQHAVAYSTGMIFNPSGIIFPYSRDNCESRGLFTFRLWRIESL